jgi:hypothetical protein
MCAFLVTKLQKPVGTDKFPIRPFLLKVCKSMYAFMVTKLQKPVGKKNFLLDRSY